MSSRKRQQRDLVEDLDPALRDYNTKRPRYDLRYGQVRECCSLPQYDKQPCQHKYHLRPFDHRKPPTNYFVSKKELHTLPAIATRSRICANNQNSTIVNGSGGESAKRNAHSYSINGHLAGRCSDSSTTSGRQRTLQALKKGKGGSHKMKEEVS